MPRSSLHPGYSHPWRRGSYRTNSATPRHATGLASGRADTGALRHGGASRVYTLVRNDSSEKVRFGFGGVLWSASCNANNRLFRGLEGHHLTTDFEREEVTFDAFGIADANLDVCFVSDLRPWK